jgi:hypothetical protein
MRRLALLLRSTRVRFAAGLLCLSAGIAALAACSPAYDWRTVTSNQNGYTVALPAKPHEDAREIDMDGTSMHMAMQTAEAGGGVFAIGTLMLPSDDPALRRKVLDFLRDGLARNVGAAPDAHPVQVPVAGGGSVTGLAMTVSGKAGAKQQTRLIYARLAARGRRVYQVAIIARAPLPREQVDQFFGSFTLH